MEREILEARDAEVEQLERALQLAQLTEQKLAAECANLRTSVAKAH